MTTEVMHGPLLEQQMLSSGLDYYKPTMSQLHYEQHPDTEVTFTFKNRGEQRLADYIDPAVLRERFHQLRDRNWTEQELDLFATQMRQNGQIGRASCRE